MDGGTRFARNSKKTQFIKSEGHEIVESHDRQRPDKTKKKKQQQQWEKGRV